MGSQGIARDAVEQVARALGAAADVAQDAAGAARRYLATDEGRELRQKVATAVIITAPLIVRTPLFRRSPLGRLVRTAALAGLLVRGAEWLRDWRPQEGRPR